MNTGTRALGPIALLLALAVLSGAVSPRSAAAIEVGQPAPDFKLPSTMGDDVSLADFRSKKWVLIEFYGADFAPA